MVDLRANKVACLAMSFWKEDRFSQRPMADFFFFYIKAFTLLSSEIFFKTIQKKKKKKKRKEKKRKENSNKIDERCHLTWRYEFQIQPGPTTVLDSIEFRRQIIHVHCACVALRETFGGERINFYLRSKKTKIYFFFKKKSHAI